MKKEIHFAPLQGFTDFIFRSAHHNIYNNIKSYYSPFIRLESNNSFRNKDIKDILPENNQGVNIIPQIIAGKPEEAKVIIDMLSTKGYRHIDINMGCPFPLITKKGKGAGILQYPDKVKEITDLLDKYEDIEFSLKMRSGMNDCNECLKITDIINNSNLKYITMHPRTGKQQYTGKADKEIFIKFAEKCNKPLIYNGDIRNIEDIKETVAIAPDIKGIMIGRGLLENPALAMEYENDKELDIAMKKELLGKFHSKIYGEYVRTLHGESQVLSHLQPLWTYLYPELEKKLRKRIIKSTKLDNYMKAVEEALR